ncbi:MAG: MFS transporter [Sedimentisphaerales bacterium]|nr:MFS transporter [Sedimentisphaerales bacterium]
MPSEKGSSRSPGKWVMLIQAWLGELPRITRLTVRREFYATIPLTALIAVTGMVFTGLIGRKALHLSDSLLATLMATNFLGLLLAGPLVGFFNRIPKIIALSRLLIAVSLVLLTISLSAFCGDWAEYVFLFQIFLVQIGMSLIIPFRAAIWRANYPARQRGKIVVLISLFMTVGISGVIMVYSAAMDRKLPFQAIYFISGISGLVAAFLIRRIRIRGERQSLRNLAANNPRQIAMLAGLQVLWQDKRFGIYMLWQFLNGFATLIIETILVVIVADVLKSNWLEGGSLLTAIPFLGVAATSVLWARSYDRNDLFVMRFRAAMAWTLSRVVLMVGVWLAWMKADESAVIGVILLSRLVSGIAMGGGQLAWRLGHMEFAPPEKDSLYMGAHVCLTGLRGIIAPFAGLALYRMEIMGPNGVWLIGISAVAQMVAAVGFLKLRSYKLMQQTDLNQL